MPMVEQSRVTAAGVERAAQKPVEFAHPVLGRIVDFFEEIFEGDPSNLWPPFGVVREAKEHMLTIVSPSTLEIKWGESVQEKEPNSAGRLRLFFGGTVTVEDGYRLVVSYKDGKIFIWSGHSPVRQDQAMENPANWISLEGDSTPDSIQPILDKIADQIMSARRRVRTRKRGIYQLL